MSCLGQERPAEHRGSPSALESVDWDLLRSLMKKRGRDTKASLWVLKSGS